MSHQENISLATRYTGEFIRKALPEGARRILEVGCGDGELAALLQNENFFVVALDNDERAVATAKSRGVDARTANWPDFADGKFDAVLFTRSLHHMHDLDKSIEAAFAALNPSGRVIVEDFDTGFSHATTLAWFKDIARMLIATGLPITDQSFLAEFAADSASPMETWHGSHEDHHLHSAPAMESALRGAGQNLTVEPAAYFFRYVVSAFPHAHELAEAMLKHELNMLDLGLIEPLGQRFQCEA